MSDSTNEVAVEDKPTGNSLESQPIPEPLVDNGSAELEDASPAKKQKIANDVEAKPASDLKPARGTREKRLSALEKLKQEGEALLGHKPDDDDPDSNRRRTRSQTRGTPPASATTPTTPSSTRKATPKTKSSDNNNSTTPKRRGRPPKNVNSAGGNQEVNNQEAVESESAELTSQVTDANETGLQPTEPIVNNNNSTANEVDAHKEVQPSDKGASNEEQVEPSPQQSQNDIVEPKPNLNSDDTSTPQPVEAN